MSKSKKPKHPEPWLRKGRGWFLQLGGRQIKLGDEGERDQAFRRYHELMARPAAAAPLPSPDGPSVLEVTDRFITFCKANKAAGTVEWYHKYLKSFLLHLAERQYTPAQALCPADVTAWTDGKATWSPTTRRQAMIAV